MGTMTMKLPLPTHSALAALAEEQKVSVGQIIRVAIDREIRRRTKSKLPEKADARLFEHLQARLGEDFQSSENWQTLQKRLSGKGYRLRESGGGLDLTDRATGNHLCKTSDLGYEYSKLLRKFRSPFPRDNRKISYKHVMSAQHA